MNTTRYLPRTMVRTLLSLLAAIIMIPTLTSPVRAGEAAEIDANVDAALERLYTEVPGTRVLAQSSAGVLVFPSILKIGLLAGVHGGRGALRINGKTDGYYRSRAVSYGLQAGAQTFGYALFFMDQSDLDYLLLDSDGVEIGLAPSLVIADQGMMRSLTTANLNQGTIAVFFSQQGLMAGGGLQGSKITRIFPN
ncbi:lipid-binding SYLF domain-containing protein [Roseovarius sp. MBR-154]